MSQPRQTAAWLVVNEVPNIMRMWPTPSTSLLSRAYQETFVEALKTILCRETISVSLMAVVASKPTGRPSDGCWAELQHLSCHALQSCDDCSHILRAACRGSDSVRMGDARWNAPNLSAAGGESWHPLLVDEAPRDWILIQLTPPLTDLHKHSRLL